MPDLNDPVEDAPPGPADLWAEAFTWNGPDRSLLSSDFGDAPRFPADMIGPFWSQWVGLSARSSWRSTRRRTDWQCRVPYRAAS